MTETNDRCRRAVVNMSSGEHGKRGLFWRHLSPFKMKRIVASSRLATVLGTLLIAASLLILGSQVRLGDIISFTISEDGAGFSFQSEHQAKPVRLN